MEITCYKNKSAPGVVYKDLTELGIRECQIYGQQSVLSPTLIFEDTSGLLPDINYVYIPEYNRYYNAVIDVLQNGLFILHCDVDALCSWWNALRTTPVIIDREEPHNDLYVDNGSFVKSVKTFNRVYNFSNGFNSTPANILICCGGERSS